MTIDEFNEKMNNKQRYGFTTGTAATAAAVGAVFLYLGRKKDYVDVDIPYGITLSIPIQYSKWKDNSYICGVIKHAGDDVDITDSILISAELEFVKENTNSLDFRFFAGEGVGTLTKKGLALKEGEPAINPMPRQMMIDNLTKILKMFNYTGVVNITIMADKGREIAKKTFNERLGIIGGISILGTSGIVLPMSKTALLETIETDIKFRIKNSKENIVYMVPGHIGARFLEEHYGVDNEKVAIISNFIGEGIDYAVSNAAKGIILCGDMGKLIKLSGGIMNTHSNDSDARLELLATAVFKYVNQNKNIDAASLQNTIAEILAQKTTTAAINIIKANGYENCFDIIGKQMLYYAYNRAFKAEIFLNKNRDSDIGKFKSNFNIKIIGFSDNSVIVNTGDLK